VHVFLNCLLTEADCLLIVLRLLVIIFLFCPIFGLALLVGWWSGCQPNGCLTVWLESHIINLLYLTWELVITWPTQTCLTGILRRLEMSKRVGLIGPRSWNYEPWHGVPGRHSEAVQLVRPVRARQYGLWYGYLTYLREFKVTRSSKIYLKLYAYCTYFRMLYVRSRPTRLGPFPCISRSVFLRTNQFNLLPLSEPFVIMRRILWWAFLLTDCYEQGAIDLRVVCTTRALIRTMMPISICVKSI